MRIDLSGQSALVCGSDDEVLRAIASALRDSGCAVTTAALPSPDAVPDLLIVLRTLRLGEAPADVPLDLDGVADAMVRRGAGRIVAIVSATAAVPSRRFPQASVAAGACLLALRTLAMRVGPAVLVNAVGCGALAKADGTFVSGDAAMLSHVPGGEAGTTDDIVNAMLFLCDPMNSYMTGQMLTVDGGWSAGYGRNF